MQRSIKHLSIKILGKVQGVNFRLYILRKASELGVSGFVWNEKDGSVRIEAEGEEAMLEELIDWCCRGTKKSYVEKVIVSEGEVIGLRAFEIK